MANAVVDKPLFVVREAGTLFAVSLDGVRNIPKIRQWWQEYLRQCWFIAKVTSVPVMFVAIPFGMVIALHVGSFSRQLGAESATGAAMVSCYKGLYCKGGPKGVGDAVNQGVVITFILIFFVNFVMTTLYFALVPQKF